jgi:spore coat polysaccharide biosynthesis protein SpsF (cytidylyltransferase family)
MYKDNKVGLIIPTRLSSNRFPNKVLSKIHDKCQLEWIIERASTSLYIDEIILAISNKKGEFESIIEFLKNYKQNEIKINVSFGDNDDIFLRCLNAAKQFNIDIIVDISHCCTFFDPSLADLLIDRLIDYGAGYSANCITRTFPDGYDIQVYTREIYEKILGIDYNPNWTGWNIWHYREKFNREELKIINFEADKKHFHPEWRLCIDYPEDLELIKKIIDYFGSDKFKYIKYWQIINYLIGNPELLEINKNLKSTKLLLEY